MNGQKLKKNNKLIRHEINRRYVPTHLSHKKTAKRNVQHPAKLFNILDLTKAKSRKLRIETDPYEYLTTKNLQYQHCP